ncbi:PREDICTED: histone-lysine N-methyltransferase ASHH1 [Tarenaya hassleriana]|uniref:histone-lysine N-methyltransferase ASHH1 n=1 Tax=Tarenaya hassleriana TaxID=28532 RepID=UPI00053C97DD|nr:PREDICTED: histone-lysine N-methyltransferase ASHH1 [Tarenaya hassleriana]
MQYTCDPDQEGDDLPQYEHIYQNDFLYRKHKKQKEEDIAICECKFDFGDPDSACGERCLNVLTSTECTPGYCPCGVYCKNQKFQKCEYAKTKLVKTEGRGWGLVAVEDIKAGQFIIEYSGEVISWKEAKRRAQAYEGQGLKDAYIISLNASEAIDATKKGSLARFINHSCRPNCETRKWTVLGEIRVGIFARESISRGTELAYDYNFEWYGGAKVRCLCGAISCSGFLGAKSRGFQEDTYVWEDGDDRYSVDKIPVYDSAEDEPTSKLSKVIGHSDYESYPNVEKETSVVNATVKPENHLESSTAVAVNPSDSTPMEDVVVMETAKDEPTEEMKLLSQNARQAFSKKNGMMISRIKSNSICRNYQIKSRPIQKKKDKKQFTGGKTKTVAQKQVDVKRVAQLLESEEARDEILKHEAAKEEAVARLSALYDEIRPAIEEHEGDRQDCVATSVAEKWIEASCLKLKAEFDLYSCLIKTLSFSPPLKPPPDNSNKEEEEEEGGTKDDQEMKLLEA